MKIKNSPKFWETIISKGYTSSTLGSCGIFIQIKEYHSKNDYLNHYLESDFDSISAPRVFVSSVSPRKFSTLEEAQETSIKILNDSISFYSYP